jgi:hypothetical protein
MDGAHHGVARDANGRFLPGCSGNPAGKKLGTRNRATVLREALADGEDKKLARLVIDKALAGDAVTARFLLERLEPKPRGRPIELELPEGESAAGDVVAAFNSTLRAMAAGQITPAEAVDVSRFLEGRFRVLRAWQLEEKLTRWSGRLPVPGDEFVPEGTAKRVKSPLRPVPRRDPTTSPPAQPPYIPSPPAERGERVAQGWRAEGEPYPELGEGGVAVREMLDDPDTDAVHRETPPHPAPAKFGDASLGRRNPLPAERGAGKAGGGEEEATLDDDLVIAVRDRVLTIPGVREVAQELGLLRKSDLHSTCKSEDQTPSEPPPESEEES